MEFYTCVGVSNRMPQDILVRAYLRELPPKTYVIPALSYIQVDSFSARTRWLHFEVHWTDLPGCPTVDIRLPALCQKTPRLAFTVLTSIVLKVSWREFEESRSTREAYEVAASRLGCTVETLKAGSWNAAIPSGSKVKQAEEMFCTTTVGSNDIPQRLADRLACRVGDLQLVYGDSVRKVGHQLRWPPKLLRKGPEGGGMAVVGTGDGYWHVAQRLGCSWSELALAEGYRSLTVGEKLEWPNEQSNIKEEQSVRQRLITQS